MGQHSDTTILVVEDDSQVRRAMVRAMESTGWKIIEASNGEEAMRVAGAYGGPIDAIVTDVKMPKMGGLELVYHFRRWYPTIRALIVSGDPEVVRQRQPPSGNVALLPKPFSNDELVAAVTGLLDA